jgi:hypothetical protein
MSRFEASLSGVRADFWEGVIAPKNVLKIPKACAGRMVLHNQLSELQITGPILSG